MKILLIILVSLLSLGGYSQTSPSYKDVSYSLNGTLQYAFGSPAIGISGIMEEKAVTFQGHILFGVDSEIRANLKMGFTLMEERNTRLVIYPLWLNANVSDNRYFTPIGVSYLRVISGKKMNDLVLNLGTEFYLKSDDPGDQFGFNGKKTFSLNISMNYLIWGQRYKKIE